MGRPHGSSSRSWGEPFVAVSKCDFRRGRAAAQVFRGPFVGRAFPADGPIFRLVQIERSVPLEFELPEHVPFWLSIAFRSSHITSKFKAFDISTSDDVCLALASTGLDWEFLELDHSLDDCKSLLDLKVTGIGETLRAKSRAKPGKRIALVDLNSAAMSMDPLAFGKSLAASSTITAAGVDCTASSDGNAPADALLGSEDEDADFPALMPDDSIYDFEEAQRRLMLGEASDGELLGDNDMAPAAADAEDVEGMDGATLEIVVVAAAVAVGAGDRSASSAAAAAAAVAPKSEAGYISCRMEPWASCSSSGRITSWPWNREEPLRNVGMRCYLHANCTSPARRRAQISDSRLLLWLFSGPLELDATRSRRLELAAIHKAQFADIEKAARDEGVATGAGAPSSSSGGP